MLEGSSELAAFVTGIGYYRPDPRKQRTQSAKQQSVRTPIGCVSMAYDASKAGLIILTKDLARGLAPEVRVNAVAPGVVDTEWTSTWPKEARQGAADRALLKRICTPQDIADVIVFLCVGTSMITGQTVAVDGGALLL